MLKIQSWLSGLLILQLLIAAGLYWQDRQQQPQQQALLSFDDQLIDRIVIADKDSKLTLSRSGKTWQLPELEKLPADTGKLNDLLNKLRQLKSAWPVTTTTSSHQRFEVADNQFQRRLQLYQGEQLLDELFIGTSPGFRKSYIRLANDDAVYSAKLNSFELPLDKNAWLDKSLLAAKDVTAIKGPDYALEKSDGAWRLGANDQPIDAQVDQDKAQQLALALSGLRVQALVSPPEQAISDKKVIGLEVSDNNTTSLYRFVQNQDQYYVSRNDNDKLFSLSQLDFNRIAKVTLSELTMPGPEGNDAPTENLDKEDTTEGLQNPKRNKN